MVSNLGAFKDVSFMEVEALFWSVMIYGPMQTSRMSDNTLSARGIAISTVRVIWNICKGTD